MPGRIRRPRCPPGNREQDEHQRCIGLVRLSWELHGRPGITPTSAGRRAVPIPDQGPARAHLKVPAQPSVLTGRAHHRSGCSARQLSIEGQRTGTKTQTAAHHRYPPNHVGWERNGSGGPLPATVRRGHRPWSRPAPPAETSRPAGLKAASASVVVLDVVGVPCPIVHPISVNAASRPGSSLTAGPPLGDSQKAGVGDKRRTGYATAARSWPWVAACTGGQQPRRADDESDRDRRTGSAGDAVPRDSAGQALADRKRFPPLPNVAVPRGSTWPPSGRGCRLHQFDRRTVELARGATPALEVLL